jgi:hypothetical protein
MKFPKIELRVHNNTLWWTNVFFKKKGSMKFPKTNLGFTPKKKTLCLQQLK